MPFTDYVNLYMLDVLMTRIDQCTSKRMKFKILAVYKAVPLWIWGYLTGKWGAKECRSGSSDRTYRAECSFPQAGLNGLNLWAKVHWCGFLLVKHNRSTIDL